MRFRRAAVVITILSTCACGADNQGGTDITRDVLISSEHADLGEGTFWVKVTNGDETLTWPATKHGEEGSTGEPRIRVEFPKPDEDLDDEGTGSVMFRPKSEPDTGLGASVGQFDWKVVDGAIVIDQGEDDNDNGDGTGGGGGA